MVVKRAGLLLVTSLWVLSACSPTRRSVPVPEQRNERLPSSEDAEGTVTFEDRRSNDGTGRDGIGQNDTGQGDNKVVSLPLSFKAAALKTHYPNLDLTKLRYHFTYLKTEERGPLTFSGDAARLTLKDLTVGQSGKLIFEVFEGDTLKFKAVNERLLLSASNNGGFKLNLQPTNGSGQSTSVDIEIELDNGGDEDSSRGGTSNEDEAQNDQTSNADRSLDQDQSSLALWDGRSFLNSADWKISAP